MTVEQLADDPMLLDMSPDRAFRLIIARLLDQIPLDHNRECVLRYLVARRADGLGERSLRSLAMRLRAYCQFLADRRVEDATPQDMRAFFTKRTFKLKTDVPTKDGTYVRQVSWCRLFGWAKACGWASASL